jgi:ketosteroid isomerase-like protein
VSDIRELDEAIDRYHATVADFITGNAGPYKEVFSQTDDISLANPFHPFALGWADAAKTMERAAEFWREGEVVGFERLAEAVTPKMAYILEIERYRAKIGGSDEPTLVELRVTSVLRPEDDEWKVLHRHADPITSARPAESVVSPEG